MSSNICIYSLRLSTRFSGINKIVYILILSNLDNSKKLINLKEYTQKIILIVASWQRCESKLIITLRLCG